MTIRAFLLGGRGGGGEEIFVRSLSEAPPPGVTFSTVLDSHASVPGARALHLRAGLFNRVVHRRLLWPLPGLRAYRVRGFDLVCSHNFPVWLDVPRGCPVVLSLGGGTYGHYLEAYLGWSPEAVSARFRRARSIYRALGIRSEVTFEHLDAVVVWSKFAAERLHGLGVPEDKMAMVPPGFDISTPGRKRDDGGPFTFLLVGRDPLRKGADVAIAAVRALRARGLDVRLRLVGDDAYPAMGDGEAIEGSGPADRERIFSEFYSRADAVLVPSRAEGFGFAAVEAMGHAVPVIASRRDTLPEIVGSAGLLVEPGSVPDLADAMEALATDRDAARARGRAGRERFESTYELGVAGRRMGDLFRRLLDRRR